MGFFWNDHKLSYSCWTMQDPFAELDLLLGEFPSEWLPISKNQRCMQDASKPASNAGRSASSLAQTVAVLAVDQDKFGETVMSFNAYRWNHHSESHRISFNWTNIVQSLGVCGGGPSTTGKNMRVSWLNMQILRHIDQIILTAPEAATNSFPMVTGSCTWSTCQKVVGPIHRFNHMLYGWLHYLGSCSTHKGLN